MFIKYYRFYENKYYIIQYLFLQITGGLMAKKNVTGKALVFRLFQSFAAFFWITYFMFIGVTTLNAKLNGGKVQKVSGLGTVLALAIILQIIAIVFLVLLKREANAKKAAEQEYNESVTELAQREFQKIGIDIGIHNAKDIALLEAQRANIQALQKKYSKPGFGVGLPGPLVIITFAIVAIQQWQKNKLKKKLDIAKVEFYNEYRRRIANPLLDTCFPGYKYYPSQGIAKEELKKLNVFNLGNFDEVITEDYVEGTYKNIHYHQSDLIVKAKNAPGQSAFLLFKGRAGIYNYRKSGFDGELIITSKKYGSHINKSDLNKTEMESMEFNKIFDVYADTPHTAYFILTPHFMEHIMDLNAHGDLYIRFVEDKICILRNHVTGMFEPDLTKPLDIEFEIGRSHYELKEIERFIDVLNIEGKPEEPTATGEYNTSVYQYENNTDSSVESAAEITSEPENTSGVSKFKLKKE